MKLACWFFTNWRPAGDECVSKLSPAAVVLQQSDQGGGRAGRLAQRAQLGHTLAVEGEDAHKPVGGGQENIQVNSWKQKRKLQGWLQEKWECTLFRPEQHFGSLGAGQAAPGLVASGSGRNTLGNVGILSARCGAQSATWWKKKGSNMK